MSRQAESTPSALDLYFEANPPMVPAIGCHIHAGWDPAVLSALRQLQALSEATGVRIQPLQIKEKFGSLRMYLRVGEVDEHQEHQAKVAAVRRRALEIVAEADSATSLICELCGSPAAAMSNLGGYICRRCTTCIEQSGIEPMWPE